jgi:hypothetical protein
MPGVPRLNSHFRGHADWPVPQGFASPSQRIGFHADASFGVPYTPRTNAGAAINISTSDMFWYIYTRTP